jgi:branched-chain amino acid transport system permease protein
MGKKRFSVRGIPKFTIYVGIIVILLLLPLFIKSPYHLHILIMTFIYIIATSSLRLLAISGQISVGHAGFMSIGAYMSGVVAKELGWTPWVTIPLGGVATMVVAILVGYPFTRLRAIYFSLVSLFFGVGILAVNSVFERYTGGYSGLQLIPPLFAASKLPYYYFFLLLTSLSLLVLYRLEFCRVGLTWKAIGQSHLVAPSVGINEAGQRVLALAVGCFFVGIAGAGYAHYNLVIAHETFGMLASVNLLVYVLVGGIGSFAGPIVGTAVLIIIPEFFRGLKEFLPYIFAGIMLIVLFLMPQGLAGLPQQVRSWFIERRKRKAVTHAS